MDEQHTLSKAPVRVIKLPGVPDGTNASNYYFPVNLDQVRELEESLFTRLEMLNLTKKAEEAAKQVFQEQIWQWFSDAQENSTTSYKGCIAPVITETHKDSEFFPSNRWGYASEEEWLDSQPKTNPFNN